MKPRALPPLLLFTIVVALLSGWGSPSAAQAQQIQVTGAVPASAEQGTINLNVKVNGKGFKNGAKAKWYVTGTTDTGGVTVNSTTFVSSTELTANISVSDTAVISNFDIQVSNSDGRGGKGTELFRVTAKGGQISCGIDVTNLSISVFKYTDATNTTTYNLWPDQTYTDGSPVPYVSGRIKGRIIEGKFQIDNCTYDLTLNLYRSNRYMTYKFPDGSIVGNSVDFTGFNADRVGNVPITDGGVDYLSWCSSAPDNYAGCGVDAQGYFVRRTYASAIDVGGNQSYGLRFNYSPLDINSIGPQAAGTAYLKVYHPDAVTWILMPDQISPPSGVIDPLATPGEWSALIDRNTYALVSYQKMPFKILVRKL